MLSDLASLEPPLKKKAWFLFAQTPTRGNAEIGETTFRRIVVRPMRIVGILIAVFGFLAGDSCLPAASLSFPEHNFAIEIPKDWIPITPRPPQILVAVQYPDASKKLLITAGRIPQREASTAPVNFRAGLKDSLVAQGWKFDADQSVESGGLSFVCLIARNPSDNHSMIAYTIVVENEAYALMFLLAQNVGTADLELRSIVRTFHLLSNKV